MSLGEGFEIEEVFESAVTIVRNLPKEGPIKPSDELKLKLYAYYKQATHGPNDTSKPRFYQIVEAYKWDAWHKLGDMGREEAMLSYISELKQVMDTIPREETSPEEGRNFEQKLGKKFYDYWFKQWHADEIQAARLGPSGRLSERPTAAAAEACEPSGQKLSNSDSSSGDSSVSLLDDTAQASCEADQGGYKTPSSLEQLRTGLSAQMGDQFALAVLRLQHGLEDTNSRMAKLEERLERALESIGQLRCRAGGPSSAPAGRAGRRRAPLAELLAGLRSVHWFYLSYPIVIYALMRLLFDRQRRASAGPRLR